MRYTLSVLTAACLLALGQPAWAETTDRDFLLRARNAALALPDTDRANATQLLQQLQARASVAPVSQRHLPFHRVFTAVNGALQQHYTTSVSAHVLPQPLVAAHWIKPPVEHLDTRPSMNLDTAMVQRWLAPWLNVAT